MDGAQGAAVKSLRRSALIWMTLMLSAVGGIAFAISYEMTRRETASFLDGQLRQIALNVGDRLAVADAPEASADPQDPEDAFDVTVWSAAGGPLRKQRNGVLLERLAFPGFATLSAGGDRWRVYMAGDDRRAVQVAQRMSVRDEIARSAAIQSGIPILAAIPLAWLVIGWSLGHALAPLTNLTGAVATRGADATEPIAITGAPIEVLPLVDAMNGLIRRLQQAMQHERRFLADAAHELRTPLAALHIQIENLQAAAGAHQTQASAALREGVQRASAMVEQLLRMARLDEAAAGAPSQHVDLAELVTDCVADYVEVAAAKGVDLGFAARQPATMTGDPQELKMLFGNLIDNAIRYTPSGGAVDVSVRRIDSLSVVEIIDTGCGVAAEQLPRLRDRFFRAAPVETEGSGLGLAIADAIAKRHAMRIDFENRADRSGFRVRVFA